MIGNPIKDKMLTIRVLDLRNLHRIKKMEYKQHSTDTDQIGALKENPRSRPTDDAKNKFKMK
jgi:hypothetical protein